MPSSHPLDDGDDDAPADDRPSNIELDYSEKAFERGTARKQEAHALPVSSSAPSVVPAPRSSAPRAAAPPPPQPSRTDAWWIAMTLIVTALLVPSAIRSVEENFGTYAFAPFALLCIAALIGAALTFARGFNLGANVLYVSGAGFVLQAILTAVATAVVAVDSRSARAFVKIMPFAGPLAAALVITGLLFHRRRKLK
jgi:hypothetical protein